VPVYYQGAAADFNKYIGKNFTFVDNPPGGAAKTYSIPGVKGAIDQTHIYQMMLETINESKEAFTETIATIIDRVMNTKTREN